MTHLEVQFEGTKEQWAHFERFMEFVDGHTVFDLYGSEGTKQDIWYNHDSKMEQESALSHLGMDIEKLVPGTTTTLR